MANAAPQLAGLTPETLSVTAISDHLKLLADRIQADPEESDFLLFLATLASAPTKSGLGLTDRVQEVRRQYAGERGVGLLASGVLLTLFEDFALPLVLLTVPPVPLQSADRNSLAQEGIDRLNVLLTASEDLAVSAARLKENREKDLGARPPKSRK